jgi:ubiquinone/menaquinone biosynthesis C-methylase UbiE
MALARGVSYLQPVSFFTATAYDLAVCYLERTCLSSWRSELLATLAGDVVELGAGTGVNLDYYHAQVERLTLVEPDSFMRRRLGRRLGNHPLGVCARVLDAPAETLSVADASVDAVVGTLVLCSVNDVAKVLSEARRVLRPGGSLALIEHVVAPIGSACYRWQSRLEPFWTFVSGGCHLLRDPRQAIKAVGFEPVSVTERVLRGVPAFIRPAVFGTWRKV